MFNNNVMTWFEMAGYGPFIWAAYGLVVIGMLLPIVSNRILHRQLPARIKQKRQRDQHGA